MTPDDAHMDTTPLELAMALEAGGPIQVLDVRAPSRVAAGRVEGVPPERFHNVVGSSVRATGSLADTGLDPRVPIVVVCGRGNDSRVVAAHLNDLGARARSLRGGMNAWMTLVLPRELAAPRPIDRLVQMDRIGKGALGYVLASDGEALIVDPPRDTRAYLGVAAESGAAVIGVADTHVHADYVSGAPALASKLGVPYYLHADDAVYPYDGTPGRLVFQTVSDGDAIRVGRADVRVRHTPGHTEGSVTYLVGDVALTGDFLFIDSIGRPDLAGKTREWSDRLWESVALARREWSPDVRIHPAHYASDAERAPDRSIGAEFGQLLATNAALQIRGRDAFVSWVEERAGAFPEAYKQIKAVNVGLVTVDDQRADELEVGRNECALGGS